MVQPSIDYQPSTTTKRIPLSSYSLAEKKPKEKDIIQEPDCKRSELERENAVGAGQQVVGDMFRRQSNSFFGLGVLGVSPCLSPSTIRGWSIVPRRGVDRGLSMVLDALNDFTATSHILFSLQTLGPGAQKKNSKHPQTLGSGKGPLDVVMWAFVSLVISL